MRVIHAGRGAVRELIVRSRGGGTRASLVHASHSCRLERTAGITRVRVFMRLHGLDRRRANGFGRLAGGSEQPRPNP